MQNNLKCFTSDSKFSNEIKSDSNEIKRKVKVKKNESCLIETRIDPRLTVFGIVRKFLAISRLKKYYWFPTSHSPNHLDGCSYFRIQNVLSEWTVLLERTRIKRDETGGSDKLVGQPGLSFSRLFRDQRTERFLKATWPRV